jgi:hypothetical protein
MAQSARKPALAAAAFFVALAVLIARLAVAPLGAADLIGIAACAAAAGAFATLGFCQLAPASTQAPGELCHQLGDKSPLDAEALAARLEARLAATVSATLAAAESARRAEQEAAIAATTPPRALDTDAIPAPAAGAKPRLGRGLLGLMHSPSALTSAAKSTPAAPSVSARPTTGDEPESERAAA